ncbi:unnamed protein product [Trichobilharzia regenti]|nr:unnamed protein product [Trichobilharzia regenti]
MKDAQGNLITKEERQMKQWGDEFKGLLNRPSSGTLPQKPRQTARTEHLVSGHYSSSERRNPECDQATESQPER